MQKLLESILFEHQRTDRGIIAREQASKKNCGHAWPTGMPIKLGTLGIVIISFWSFGQMNGIWISPLNLWKGVLWAKTLIEVVASLYGIFFFLVALNYRLPVDWKSTYDLTEPQRHWGNESGMFLSDGERRMRTWAFDSLADELLAISKNNSCHIDAQDIKFSQLVIGYLCCDDLDREALDSIAKYCGGSEVPIIIHDDSIIQENCLMVDEAAAQLRNRYARDVRILRREERAGGKPGAVNHIVRNLSCNHKYLLICDSDSYFYDKTTLERALRYFRDPEVALVQFRNIGHVRPNEIGGFATLSESVTFYDTFVLFLDNFGWSPFLGHNALLRLDVFNEVGGFVPGQFADDIDYSVRLRLFGYKIRYGREIIAGERHPETYSALRRRTFKWAYGCTQILRDSGWQVLWSAKISWSDKLTFFLTVGYYHFQIMLLAYLGIFYLLLPLVDRSMGGLVNLIVSAGMILLLTFLPSLSYFARQERLSKWLPTVVIWGFVYGSQDFELMRATVKCLARRHLEWLPTNLSGRPTDSPRLLPEFLFGALIVIVALLRQPLLLLLPTTVLFAGKYLMAPFLQRNLFSLPSRGCR